MADDDPSESSSSLPWIWVIEALAGIKGISISALQGLIDAAPVGPADLGESTRELVALRCLEELSAASAQGAVNLDSSSTLDSRAGFDFSCSCEDVLQEVFHEIHLSDLKMAGEKLLKSNIHPFIMHKRASTAKCHLEQLKESILEGTLPLTDILKERSGLFQRNRGYTVHVSDRECNDHLERDGGNSTYAENRGAKENSVPLILENGNKSPGEQKVDSNFLPSKRNRVHSSDEHLTGYHHEKQVCVNECDDYVRNTKRIKCYGSTSLLSEKEKLVSQLGKEVSKNFSDEMISEKRWHQTEKDNRGTLCNRSVEDNHNWHTASNLCRSCCHNEVFHDESNISCNATVNVIPQQKSGGQNSQQQTVEAIPKNVALPVGIHHKISGCKTWSQHDTDSNDSQQTVPSDKAQDDTSNGCGVEISSDRIVSEGEKINLIKKRHEEKEKLISQPGKEVSNNLSDEMVSGKRWHQTGKNSRKTLCNRSVEDNHNWRSASNLCQSSCHNDHDESNISCNATVIPQHESGGRNSQQQPVEAIPKNVALPAGIHHNISGFKSWSKHVTDSYDSQQTVARYKAQDDTSNGCGVEISSDRIVSEGEKINLIKTRHEENFSDMKCNKGSHLLICEATTVPLVVPQSCLDLTLNNSSPQHVSLVEPCQITSMDEIDDTVHVEPIPTVDDNLNNIQLMINESQPEQKEPNVESLHASQQPVASNKTVIGTGYGYAAKKYEYLCSQYTFGRDLSAMTESTEQNLCIKCNEGGQLLVCKTTTCQLMMHKNCLGASGQLHANGDFFCPFCTYSHTISEYLEAKRKVSSARKELAVFISRGISNQAAEHVHEFSRHQHSLSRKSGKSEHTHIENNVNDPLTRSEENRGDHVGEHANEINNLQFKRSQQQAPKSCVHSSCRLKENVNNGLADDVTREEDSSEMPNAKSLIGGKVEEDEGPNDLIDRSGGDFFSCRREIAVPGNRSSAGEEVRKNMTKLHNMDAMVETGCAHDTGKAEISEGEGEKHSVSRDSTGFHKQGILYSKRQASPQSRRKKIPWTAEEEELIQEGVHKFNYNDSNIPWKRILAFGSHVFENNHRMPQDLKDKWKNMCKTHSKLK